MAFTVTNRGYAFKSYASSDSVSDTFTPAANSVLMVVSVGQDGVLDSISDTMSDTGAWAEVLSYSFTSSFGASMVKVWASIVGASPTSGAITVVNGYHQKLALEFYEIGGADVSGGTPASVFGVSAGYHAYSTPQALPTLTLSSFASSSNMTFAVAFSDYSGTAMTFTEGTFTSGTSRNDTFALRCGWLTSEDTTIAVSGQAFANKGDFGFEIKLASGGGGGGGEVSGTPLQNLGSGFGPARAARLNGVLQ